MLTVSCTSNNTTDGQDSTLDKTPSPYQYGEPVLDTDGQVYQTITIGSQIWMAEDLKKTEIECNSNQQARFTNGLERGPGVKLYVNAPRYAWYKNDKELGYGVIYNFSALQHCQLCPSGYQIPSIADWETLIDEIGGKMVAAKKLIQKENIGFNARLGGRIDSYGSVMAGSVGFWWCSDMKDEQEGYILEIGNIGYVKLIPQQKRTGVYVRCIKK